MNLKHLFFFSIMLVSAAAFGHEPDKSTATAAVTGKILDASNAEALTGATIFIKELNLKTFASFDGTYSFTDLPAGVYTIEVSFVSYEKLVYENVDIKPGESYRKFYMRGN